MIAGIEKAPPQQAEAKVLAGLARRRIATKEKILVVNRINRLI